MRPKQKWRQPTAECEQEVPYNTPSRARSRATQGAKALEVAHLHVSILHQKLEAESKLHGLQSPQNEGTRNVACAMSASECKTRAPQDMIMMSLFLLPKEELG